MTSRHPLFRCWFGRDWMRGFDWWEAGFVWRPRLDLTAVGSMVAGWHFQCSFRLPAIRLWAGRVPPSAANIPLEAHDEPDF
jgi:hypothetical protein